MVDHKGETLSSRVSSDRASERAKTRRSTAIRLVCLSGPPARGGHSGRVSRKRVFVPEFRFSLLFSLILFLFLIFPNAAAGGRRRRRCRHVSYFNFTIFLAPSQFLKFSFYPIITLRTANRRSNEREGKRQGDTKRPVLFACAESHLTIRYSLLLPTQPLRLLFLLQVLPNISFLDIETGSFHHRSLARLPARFTAWLPPAQRPLVDQPVRQSTRLPAD